MTQLLGRDEFRAELENAIMGREAKNASFSGKAWAEGKLSKQHFARWAENHYHYVGPFADYLANIYSCSNTPDEFTGAKGFHAPEHVRGGAGRHPPHRSAGSFRRGVRHHAEHRRSVQHERHHARFRPACYAVSQREHFVRPPVALVVGLESQAGASIPARPGRCVRFTVQRGRDRALRPAHHPTSWQCERGY